MPLVGGELAKAAFDHGFEDYGVDILTRYHALISEKQESYLWYFPDGTPASVEASTSPEAQPTDGWGSSAMLWALLSGLVGIEDLGKGFDTVKLSPKWSAAGVEEAEVRLEYAASGAAFGYAYRAGSGSLMMTVEAPGSDLSFHLMLPPGATPKTVKVGEADTPFRISDVRESRYLDFSAVVRGEAEVRVELA
jgi:hypothetical protein